MSEYFITTVEFSAYFFQHGIKKRHIGFLGLDGVTEKGIGLIWQQRVNWYLFDAKNE